MGFALGLGDLSQAAVGDRQVQVVGPGFDLQPTGLDQILTLHSSVEEAVDALSAG